MIDIKIEYNGDDQNEKKTEPNANSPFVIPVVEEQAQINKKVVESGRLRITKSVQEQEEVINHTLFHEEHQVERVPINEFVDSPPPPVRHEGDTIIIPVIREVVQVRLLVVEELHITKKQVQSQVNQTITLLKEEVKVEHQTSGSEENKPT